MENLPMKKFSVEEFSGWRVFVLENFPVGEKTLENLQWRILRWRIFTKSIIAIFNFNGGGVIGWDMIFNRLMDESLPKEFLFCFSTKSNSYMCNLI